MQKCSNFTKSPQTVINPQFATGSARPLDGLLANEVTISSTD